MDDVRLMHDFEGARDIEGNRDGALGRQGPDLIEERARFVPFTYSITR